MMTLILKAEVIVDINVNIIYLPLTYKMSGPLYIYYILYIYQKHIEELSLNNRCVTLRAI